MYNVLAAYYDLIHDQLTEDLDFVLLLAEECGGSILELGCGTGRLLLPLVRARHSVTGVDSEQAMLDRALQRLNQETPEVRQRATLLLDDMRNLSLSEKNGDYKLAVFSYNTLLHFQAGEIVQILRSVAGYLSTEGYFYIDMANPYIIEEDSYKDYPVLENRFSNQTTGETIVQMSHSQLDSAAQCLHTTWYFDRQMKSGQLLAPVSVEMDYWYHFPHQMELLVRQSGLRLENIFGDYDRSEFNEQSERLLILARHTS